MTQLNKINDLEDGRRESDIKPKWRDDPKLKRRGVYMDEAITKTGFGLFNYVLIGISAVILNSVVMETCGMTFILPVSQCDLNLTANQKGILAGISFAGMICSSHLWGFLADTRGRRSVIQPTLFIAFVMTVASSLATNFYLFAIFRFLNGFFISGGSATIYAYLSEFHNTTQRARAIMATSVIFAALCNLVPMIAWAVINREFEFYVPFIDVIFKPWRLFLVVCGLPSLFAFIVITFLPESPKFLLGQGKQAEAQKIIHKINRVNNGSDSKLNIVEIYEEGESIENRQRILEAKKSRFPFLSSVWIQTAPLFLPPYLYPTLLICCIQFFIYTTSNGFFMFFAEVLNTMAHKSDSIEQQMCDVINSKSTIFNVTNNGTNVDVCVTKLELETIEQGVSLEFSYTISLFLIGLLVNKVGKFPLLFISLVGPGMCGILCMYTTTALLQKISFIVLMLSCIGPNIVNAATVEVYPTSLRGMAICISLMFARLGSVVGANVAAVLLYTHCQTLFYLSGATLIGAGILTFFIPKIHQRVSGTTPMLKQPRASVISFA